LKNILFFLLIGIGINVSIRSLFRTCGIILGGIPHPASIYRVYAFQFIRDAASILTLTPLILTFWWDFRFPRFRKRFLEALILGAILSVSTYLTFGKYRNDRHVESALVMMPLPIMIISVIRFSGRGAAVSSCLIAFIAFIQTL